MTGRGKGPEIVVEETTVDDLTAEIDRLVEQQAALQDEVKAVREQLAEAERKLAAYQVPYSLHIVLTPRHYNRLADQCRAHGVDMARRVDQIIRAAYPTEPSGGTIPLDQLAELKG